jgi:hypothetical protein
MNALYTLKYSGLKIDMQNNIFEKYKFTIMTVQRILFLLCLTTFFFGCRKKDTVAKEVKQTVNYIPYYLKVVEADSLFQIRNYQKSYAILDNLFKRYKPIQTEEYWEYSTYIASAVMTGHTENINKMMKKSITDFGNFSICHRDADQLYDTLIKVSKFTESDFVDLTKVYSKKINLSLRKKIEIMLTEDQSVRIPKLNYEGMKHFEEKHKKQIEEIISKYGYPSYQVIGHNGYDTNQPIHFYPIFLHQSIEIKDRYLPMLLDNLKKGKCSPYEYAFIFDKAYIEKNNNKGYYGVISEYRLDYPKKIDSIRKSIGLPRYGYEKWRDKLIYPEDYQKK